MSLARYSKCFYTLFCIILSPLKGFRPLFSHSPTTCHRPLAPHSSVPLTHYSPLHNSLFSLLPNSCPFSPNRAIRSFGQSHSSISYDVTAPYTPHGTLSSFYSQLQDGGPHTTQRCSLLPPLRNNIYHSIRRHHTFLSFFPKI